MKKDIIFMIVILFVIILILTIKLLKEEKETFETNCPSGIFYDVETKSSRKPFTLNNHNIYWNYGSKRNNMLENYGPGKIIKKVSVSGGPYAGNSKAFGAENSLDHNYRKHKNGHMAHSRGNRNAYYRVEFSNPVVLNSFEVHNRKYLSRSGGCCRGRLTTSIIQFLDKNMKPLGNWKWRNSTSNKNNIYYWWSGTSPKCYGFQIFNKYDFVHIDSLVYLKGSVVADEMNKIPYKKTLQCNKPNEDCKCIRIYKDPAKNPHDIKFDDI